MIVPGRGNLPDLSRVEGYVAVEDDDRLIDLALAGNSAAFGDLVRKYQDRLYNTIVHVIGSTEDARDVVQDAFVQAFVKLETFQRTSAFYTWLYRIAFNAAISQKRRRRPTLSVEQQRENSGEEPIDGGEAPEEGLERQELAAQVRVALANLSEEHRAVIVLREMDGHDYDAIAGILELPVGTVRSRLHRARLQLREELKQVLQLGQR
ncbi:MAG TPA: sigma-70 family RNA polymerase sigma factor [Pirellulales bacterium]|nr:sigma-70 family RNA polymerase sigma factor [Pirellulales bacterium]